MVIKVNAIIEMNEKIKEVSVEVWDVDLLVDDKLSTKKINSSGPIEFLISASDSGEINPELQIRIIDASGNEIFRSSIDSSIKDFSRDQNSGFIEQTTIDFGHIKI